MPLIQHRRGTAAAWTAANPTLGAGEFGYETDTGKLKVGNGTQNWVALPYFEGEPGPTGPTGPAGPGNIVVNPTSTSGLANGTIIIRTA